ncbi:hypothetical protein QM600_23345, partial [Rhodococcus sp. IEGM 1379]|nr:hypothetical protein [Rhodococcus sp. IEGM 1379]
MSTSSILEKPSPSPPSTPRPASDQIRRLVAKIAPGPGALAQAGLTVIALAVALLLSTLLVAATGGSPGAVATALVEGSISDAASWSQTLLAAAPLLIVAVGACVGNRAGAFNIGQEGQ